MVDAFSGMLGGPLADLAELIGPQLSVIRAPIAHEVAEGRGSLTIGDGTVVAEMEPYRGPDGRITTLQNSIFSTVPGSPAWVGKASRFAVDLPEHGWTYDFTGRNAIQSDWTIDYRGEAARALRSPRRSRLPGESPAGPRGHRGRLGCGGGGRGDWSGRVGAPRQPARERARDRARSSAPPPRLAGDDGRHDAPVEPAAGWALMLVMFAAGAAGLLWMAALTAVMVHEKTRPSGARTVPLTGVVLLAAGSTLLLWAANANGAF